MNTCPNAGTKNPGAAAVTLRVLKSRLHDTIANAITGASPSRQYAHTLGQPHGATHPHPLVLRQSLDQPHTPPTNPDGNGLGPPDPAGFNPDPSLPYSHRRTRRTFSLTQHHRVNDA